MNITKYIVIGIIVVLAFMAFNQLALFSWNQLFNIGSPLNFKSNADFHEAYDNSFALDISSISSEVMIQSGNTRDIQVEFFKETSDKYPQLDVKKRGNTLKIEVKHDTGFLDWFNFTSDNESQLSITLPKDYEQNITVSTVSGSINNSSELQLHDLILKTTSGQVSLESISADYVEVSSVSGQLDLDDITADSIEVKTTSGDIHLYSISCDSLEHKTISGDTISEKIKSDSLTYDSISGDVEHHLSDDFKVTLDTMSGDFILNNPSLSIDKQTDKELQGTIGNDRHSLKIKTLSGNITLE